MAKRQQSLVHEQKQISKALISITSIVTLHKKDFVSYKTHKAPLCFSREHARESQK